MAIDIPAKSNSYHRQMELDTHPVLTLPIRLGREGQKVVGNHFSQSTSLLDRHHQRDIRVRWWQREGRGRDQPQGAYDGQVDFDDEGPGYRIGSLGTRGIFAKYVRWSVKNSNPGNPAVLARPSVGVGPHHYAPHGQGGRSGHSQEARTLQARHSLRQGSQTPAPETLDQAVC